MSDVNRPGSESSRWISLSDGAQVRDRKPEAGEAFVFGAEGECEANAWVGRVGEADGREEWVRRVGKRGGGCPVSTEVSCMHAYLR